MSTPFRRFRRALSAPPEILLSDRDDAIALAFALRERFVRGVGVVLVDDQSAMFDLVVVDVPHSEVDAVADLLRLGLARRAIHGLIIVSLVDRDPEVLAEADLVRWRLWNGNFTAIGVALHDWLIVGPELARSMATTTRPNNAY